MPFPVVSGRPMAELLSLVGKRVVVTGGSQGIGAAVARRLAEQGATLTLAARSADKLERLADELGSEAHPAHVVTADLSRPVEVARLADRAVDLMGGIDIWISNAGVLAADDLFDIDEERWDAVYDLNVKAVFFDAQAAARHMREHGGGVILNTASSLAFHSVPGQPHYVSSKWAVRGLTSALAADLGRYGIRVLAVAPGLTRSEGKIGGVNHFAFEVDDIDEVFATLQRDGVDAVQPPADIPGSNGERFGFVSDGDGMLIELFQPVAEPGGSKSG